MTTNVALEILGKQEIECLHCHLVGNVDEFCRLFTNRGGLQIVHCECPTCYGRWRRIVCA